MIGAQKFGAAFLGGQEVPCQGFAFVGVAGCEGSEVQQVLFSEAKKSSLDLIFRRDQIPS